MQSDSGLAESRLAELGISLEEKPRPTGNYLPYTVVPPMLYLSGVTAKHEGKPMYTGRIGVELDKEAGYQAARQCLIHHLGTLKSVLGELDRIERIVKVTGFIQAESSFAELPFILNGASDLLIDVFGEKGKHARSAIGAAALPGCAPVEVEMIVKFA